MKPKEFWREYDIARKEQDKWEKRAEKTLKRYRGEADNTSNTTLQTASFNILWANTSVLQPALFSQTPKPDIRRRYRDEDPVALQGSRVLERGLEFVMDDGDYYNFGVRSVMDYLLPGRTVCKIRYSPLISRRRKPIDVQAQVLLSPLGEEVGRTFFLEDEEIDSAEVQFRSNGTPFIERDEEEVVDESVIIERWPWKNFVHQHANRWQDVEWIDYVSFMDRPTLKKFFGRKADEIQLTVDSTGDQKGGNDRAFKPTHAEVHEVWFKRSRKVKVGVKSHGDTAKWLKEIDDPLRLEHFYPTPPPLLAIDTNDSLEPIPLFTLYQHQANELDLITRRISVLMRALKMAGLYAGQEKETLQRLFEADENVMIPVADWSAMQGSGGVDGLISWMPVEQAGKVLSSLFAERDAIITQIFELTGIADIQRGSTDPRETRGAQQLKAQFASRRNLTPKQEVERYFRDTLRIAAEIMSEHFDAETLERMTGLSLTVQVPTGRMMPGPDGNPVPETQPASVKQILEDELTRQYRIDIETDSTVAPDEERDKAQMAEALSAVSNYVAAMAPLVQQGLSPQLSIVLLKTYLRKFKFGREIEEILEQLQNQPPPEPQPDPEMIKLQADMQRMQADLQIKQAESQLKLQEMSQRMQLDAAAKQQDLQQDAQAHDQDISQDEEAHTLEMVHDEEKHNQELRQADEKSDAQVESIKKTSEAQARASERQAAARPNTST